MTEDFESCMEKGGEAGPVLSASLMRSMASGFSRRDFMKAAALLPFAPFFFSSADALNVKGLEYISVAELAKYLGMQYKTVVAKKRQIVFSKFTQIYFDVNQKDVLLNGNKIWFGSPIVEAGGLLYLAKRDYLKSIVPLLYPQRSGKPEPLYHIVLDPGHGGKDTGAINKAYGLHEKNVALDMALRVGKILITKGYKISYTRTKDVFVELEDRVKRANALKADMFISLHFNSATPAAAGLETYSLTPAGQTSTNVSSASLSDSREYEGNRFDAWNTLLSYYVQTQIVHKASGIDRGARRARFYVLKDINMPAVLVEGGFVSNAAEGKKICSADYRAALAEGVANGVLKFQSTIDRLRGR